MYLHRQWSVYYKWSILVRRVYDNLLHSKDFLLSPKSYLGKVIYDIQNIWNRGHAMVSPLQWLENLWSVHDSYSIWVRTCYENLPHSIDQELLLSQNNYLVQVSFHIHCTWSNWDDKYYFSHEEDSTKYKVQIHQMTYPQQCLSNWKLKCIN